MDFLFLSHEIFLGRGFVTCLCFVALGIFRFVFGDICPWKKEEKYWSFSLNF